MDYIVTGLSSILIYESVKYVNYYLQYKVNLNPKRFLLSIIKKTSYGKQKIDEKINDTKSHLINDLTIDNIETKYLTIPKDGMSEIKIFDRFDNLINKDCDWENGKAFGYVYHGGKQHNALLHKAYKMFSNTNPLHSSAFKSTRILECEVIRMTARMLHGNDNVCGCMTSGGTESIILAVKAAKDYFLSKHPNTKPEIVCCNTAHVAFIKAANYFNIDVIITKPDKDYRANPKEFLKNISKRTMMFVVSSPCYPYGIIDNIKEISEIALINNIWLHVDACLGGFILPWLDNIPSFDFRLKGVSSMSCDTHKYGYASKGSSVVLYKNSELRKYQYFCWSEWTGGLFASPSILGSRAGGTIASAWTSLVSVGQNNYIEYAKQLMEVRRKIFNTIETIKEIDVIGKPCATVFAIKSNSEHLDIFVLADELEKNGWYVERQQKPSSLHFTITLNQIKHIDDFIEDFKQLIETSRGLEPTNKAAIYGNAVSVNDPEIINEILVNYTGLCNDVIDNGGLMA